MSAWQMALYALASFLALRSLLSLMAQHRKEHRRKFLALEQARMQRDAADVKQVRPRSNRAADPAA